MAVSYRVDPDADMAVLRPLLAGLLIKRGPEEVGQRDLVRLRSGPELQRRWSLLDEPSLGSFLLVNTLAKRRPHRSKQTRSAGPRRVSVVVQAARESSWRRKRSYDRPSLVRYRSDPSRRAAERPLADRLSLMALWKLGYKILLEYRLQPGGKAALLAKLMCQAKAGYNADQIAKTVRVLEAGGSCNLVYNLALEGYLPRLSRDLLLVRRIIGVPRQAGFAGDQLSSASAYRLDEYLAAA